MKATELRIGNFIQDQFDDIIIVDGLDDMKYEVNKIIK